MTATQPAETSAELDLRTSEARYRRLFETAKDGILILEAESGRIIDVNPYLAALLEHPRSDFLGKRLWEVAPLRDIVANQGAFAELQARDYIAYEDLPLETKSGRRVDVGFVSNAYDVDGERFIQCNVRDITARKSADRAHAALEDQLRASQKLDAIGRLAGGLAHDFNNLLSVILCCTKFVIDALPADSPLRADLSEVDQAAERAAELTRQLLAFGRKQVLQPVTLELNSIVENVERMLRRVVGEDITLTTVLTADPGLTLADPGQLEQVIMNLAINARDAMPKGGALTIETQNTELDATYASLHADVQPGRYVMLSVTDTGVGMDAETSARMFEPFFTTKGPGQGTGLGLATVYGIVKQTGGHVSVYSEPQHGTTFKVYLPRSASTGARASVPVAVGPALRRPTGTETILVVEDDATVRNVAHRILSKAGYAVLVAASGPQALAICASRSGTISLVLSDVVMPHMSGPAFAHKLRGLSPCIKVLFMSGYSGDALALRGVLDHATRFIEKPFTAEGLARKVRETLDERTEPVLGG